MKDKIIIISPHMDDEVYGCSSFLQRKDLVIVYFTSYHSGCPHGENIAENRKLIGYLGCEAIYLDFNTNMLDITGQARIIVAIEKVINENKPETVLLPCPSYNQDHRAIYDAALTAMRRHDKNHFVKRILLYEEPETWDSFRKPQPFKPNYFRPLDIGVKRDLISIYSSQMRGHRSLEHVEAIARVRGMQANMEYAEAFEVVRWIKY